jgi:VanZ family protein
MAATAFILAVGFAGLDEMHQVFVLGRTASVFDVGWDGLGAMLALMGRYAIWRS